MFLVVRNTPSLLIPKELFQNEKIKEYWNVLYPCYPSENFGIDDLENFFLLYSKPNEEDSIHEISVLYKEFPGKFPNHEHAVCINVYEDGVSFLVIKDKSIAYTGYFKFSVNEEVLYHLTNIYQHYFENIYQVVFAYQQLSPAILRLLCNYYEMKKI